MKQTCHNRLYYVYRMHRKCLTFIYKKAALTKRSAFALQGEKTMTDQKAAVTYNFGSNSLKAVIFVGPPKPYKDANGQIHEGFPILQGSGGSYVGTDGNSHTFQFQVNPMPPTCNVLWLHARGGAGGSAQGIDQDGLTILGDQGDLVWNGQGESFAFQEGALDLASVQLVHSSWPPKF
jgi:hypothetical protein